MSTNLEVSQKILGESWANILGDELHKVYMRKLAGIIRKERTRFNIFPESADTFNAYKLCPFDRVKVIILGQDPYYRKDQAHGLAFSTPVNLIDTPPSLDNIFREMENDLGIDENFRICHTSDLTRWAEQGVFLLNSVLTVREGRPGSHRFLGWERFTTKTIRYLSICPTPMVFMLWGNEARGYREHIDDDFHLVLEAAHPSPRSADKGFFGCKHFSQANDFLRDTYGEGAEIQWVEPKSD